MKEEEAFEKCVAGMSVRINWLKQRAATQMAPA